MLDYVNYFLALARTHPREALVLLLFVGWVANWALGSLDALASVPSRFSFQEWPRLLRSQLASSQVLVIWALYGGSVLALIGDAVTKVWLGGHVSQTDVDFVVNRVLDLAAGASGLYAAKVWHEVIWLQLPDVVNSLRHRLSYLGGSRVPPPSKRNLPVGAVPDGAPAPA